MSNLATGQHKARRFIRKTLSLSLAASCVAGAALGTTAHAAEVGKIGLGLPMLTSPFWQSYNNYLPKYAKQMGIDILAPDIYLLDFPSVIGMYQEKGRGMFIPESRASAANAYYAIGHGNSIGYSPFGIDNERNDANGPFPAAYAILDRLAPKILEAQAGGKIGAVWLSREKTSDKISLGDYTLNIELRTTRGSNALPDAGYALAILSGPDEYIISGSDVQVTFTPNTVAIGQAFTVRLQRTRHLDQPQTEWQDGTYTVALQKWTPSSQSFWDFLVPQQPKPKSPTTPGSYELGKIELVGGTGQATYELKGDYGNGLTLEPGLPVIIDIKGPNNGLGTGLLVAKP